jgi:hypothetical protein
MLKLFVLVIFVVNEAIGMHILSGFLCGAFPSGHVPRAPGSPPPIFLSLQS